MLHYPLLLFSSHVALILSGMSQEWTIPQHVSCQSPEYIYSLLQATKHIHSVMFFFFFPFASIWLFHRFQRLFNTFQRLFNIQLLDQILESAIHSLFHLKSVKEIQ